MDSLTLLIAILLMIIGLTYGATWIVLAVIAIVVLTSRSLMTLLIMVGGAGVIYFMAGSGMDLTAIWPILVFGLIIVSLAFNKDEAPKQPDMMGGDMSGFGGLGGMMGGYQ
ncbi:MAG: hypothetical protein HY917_01885 [Candidatus Diapherotrites archaeon]|nr:hypothetical protein [Candidatus Diapherotrites archaeon]